MTQDTDDGDRLEIRLNGASYAVTGGATLLSLLENLERDPRTLAIEHNGEIVRRSDLGRRPLAAGDQVEIVHFVQGG